MLYRVTHTTKYDYEQPVTLCQNLARLTPLNTGAQICHSSIQRIEPKPQTIRKHQDVFGNQVSYFEISKELQFAS